MDNKAFRLNRSSHPELSTVTREIFDDTMQKNLPGGYRTVQRLVSNVNIQWLGARDTQKAPLLRLEGSFNKYEAFSLILEVNMVRCNCVYLLRKGGKHCIPMKNDLDAYIIRHAEGAWHEK